MPNDTMRVKVEAKDPDLGSQLEDIIRSVEGFSVQRSDNTRPADLLIFELGDDTEKDFEVIHSLLDVDAIGEVFYTSRHTDQAVLLRAMRTGAKEFFSQPIKEQEVKQALEKFKERKNKTRTTEPGNIGQII
jgi:pilus assembly protein CpaE